MHNSMKLESNYLTNYVKKYHFQYCNIYHIEQSNMWAIESTVFLGSSISSSIAYISKTSNKLLAWLWCISVKQSVSNLSIINITCHNQQLQINPAAVLICAGAVQYGNLFQSRYTIPAVLVDAIALGMLCKACICDLWSLKCHKNT